MYHMVITPQIPISPTHNQPATLFSSILPSSKLLYVLIQDLDFLRELYLTGNPCVEFAGYRDYVIATLPQLERLDGIEIEKSERIKAVQNYSTLKNSIEMQEAAYMLKRVSTLIVTTCI